MGPVPGLIKDPAIHRVPEKIYGPIDTSDMLAAAGACLSSKFNKEACCALAKYGSHQKLTPGLQGMAHSLRRSTEPRVARDQWP